MIARPRSAAQQFSISEDGMSAYQLSLALIGLVTIVIWEGLS
jgi:hypothetical protein